MKKIKEGFDLLSFLNEMTKGKGINPSDYAQTLREANGKRWGNSTILRKEGIGIDLIFQEFEMYYPSMFDSLDDFVDALADRLGRKKSLRDEFDEEEIALIEQRSDDLILGSQVKAKLNKLESKVLEEDGLITREGRKRPQLTQKAIKLILERSLE
jgi:hypothetical protein